MYRLNLESFDLILSLTYFYNELHCLTVHLQIEEISRRLRTGDLGIPANPEERFEAIAAVIL